MNLKELEKNLKYFEKTGKTSEELNTLRTTIFDSADANEIQYRVKVRLLKELYTIATLKGIFFLRVMDRTPGLPKNDQEEQELKEAEDESYDSYEESYSYEEDEEES